jgi:hypothetical protein
MILWRRLEVVKEGRAESIGARSTNGAHCPFYGVPPFSVQITSGSDRETLLHKASSIVLSEKAPCPAWKPRARDGRTREEISTAQRTIARLTQQFGSALGMHLFKRQAQPGSGESRPAIA